MFPSLGLCSPDMVLKLDDCWVQQPWPRWVESVCWSPAVTLARQHYSVGARCRPTYELFVHRGSWCRQSPIPVRIISEVLLSLISAKPARAWVSLAIEGGSSSAVSTVSTDRTEDGSVCFATNQMATRGVLLVAYNNKPRISPALPTHPVGSTKNVRTRSAIRPSEG